MLKISFLLKYSLFFLSLLGSMTGVWSQNYPIGNEWINFNQTYYKLTLAEDGIYRLSYQDLVEAGIPIDNIPASQFKMYHLGEEIALYIKGDDNDRIDEGDEILFWGVQNRGALDEQLYRTPEEHPHPYYSLFTDTSVYFLTWDTDGNGKRMQVYSNTNYSAQAEWPYLMRERINLVQDTYNDGVEPIRLLRLSYYTEQEGWSSHRLNKGQSNTYNVSTSNTYRGGVDAKVEMLIYGFSDERDDNGNIPNVNHGYNLLVRPGAGAYSQLLNDEFRGFERRLYRADVVNSLIGNNTTNVRIENVGVANVSTSSARIKYVKLNYPINTSFDVFPLMAKLPEESGQNFFLSFDNYPSGKNSPLIFDIEGERVIKNSLNGQNLRTIVPENAAGHTLYFADEEEVKTPTSLSSVNFIDYNQLLSGNYDFLIVTHPSLSSGAEDYAAYRNGTGFTSRIVYTPDLMEQFSYGIHHALSVYNFFRYLNALNLEPDYALMLGKGLQNDFLRDGNLQDRNLVPAIGIPPTDNLYATSLYGGEIVPRFPIARIPANTNGQIRDYLDKLRTHEQSLDEVASWRKRMMHFSGGQDAQASATYSNFLNGHARIAEGPQFGGRVRLYANEITTINTSFKDEIVRSFNQGITLTNYFGHGSADVLEIDIGRPSQDNFQNEGKLSAMFFTGCLLGNPHAAITNNSIAEDYIFAPNVGAINFMSSSSYSFTGASNAYTLRFYENLFDKQYGDPIGQSFVQAMEDYGNVGNVISEMLCLQMVMQGDPAVRIYSPEQPDYEVTEANLFITPENANALSDSFAVGIIIDNIGRAVEDSFDVLVRRTLPNSQVVAFPPKRIAAPLNRDTIYYYISTPDLSTRGLNRFEVQVDANNEVAEIDELNNTATLEYFMAAGGVSPLFPLEYGIVPERRVNLVAQANDLLRPSGVYIFEIDTVPTFDSPWKRRSDRIAAGNMPEFSVLLQDKDTTAYYWRVQIESEEARERVWQSSTFTYIQDSPEGWAQVHFPQFRSFQSDNMSIDDRVDRFNFSRTNSGRYQVISSGEDAASYERRIRLRGSLTVGSGMWNNVNSGNGMVFTALNPDNLTAFSYNSSFNNVANRPQSFPPDENGLSGIFFFNWLRPGQPRDDDIVDSALAYLNRVPDGYYVLGSVGRLHDLPDLPEEFKQALRNINIFNFEQIQNGYPYAFVGRKGESNEFVEELLPDFGDSLLPPREQRLDLAKIFSIFNTSGDLFSSQVGPASEWGDMHYAFKKPLNRQDSFAMRIVPLDSSFSQDLSRDFFGESSKTLQNIDANLNPYLQLNTYLENDSARIPPQLDKWVVTYETYPEGSLQPELAYEFYNDTILQGDSIYVKVAYQNISNRDFADSLPVRIRIRNDEREIVAAIDSLYAPLVAGEHFIIQESFQSRSFSPGKYELSITVNPDAKVPELFLYNNFLGQEFVVEGDDSNPLLDVTFDGYRIMDGDIVSPSPEITISLKDDNPFFILDDTSHLALYLKHPQEEAARRIYFAQEHIIFNPGDEADNEAEVIYRPESLADGDYELRVEARDASGNPSGSSDYRIAFKVINASTITHFYPYPNPFSTKTRFVFTLTGAQIPDDIRIQIMTITGRVVKNIRADELGPIRIGHNITDYYWDGKDEYGGELANGVYFYKVSVFVNGERVEHRDTEADQMFKNNVGKMYILR